MQHKIDKVDQSIVTHFAVLWLITNTITLIGSLFIGGWWTIAWFILGLLISDRLAEKKERIDYKVKGIFNLADRWAQWRFKDVYRQIMLNVNGKIK